MVTLRGGLGSGKTTFVRAVVRALHGSDDAVSSPTFVFRQRYDGTPPVEHIDLYRLENPAAEWPELGLDDAFTGGTLALVEWPERAAGRLPPGRIEVAIEGVGDGPRRVRITRPARAATRAVRILAFDAALGGFSAALDDGATCSVAATGRQDALERGLGRIGALLAEAGCGWRPGPASRSASAPARSPACGSRSPTPKRWPTAAACRWWASRRTTPSNPPNRSSRR